jgi:hypothetical protein
LNKVYSKNIFHHGVIILDYGGGKYNTNKDYMEKTYGAIFVIYDKYNRSDEENRIALEFASTHHLDYIICSNLLNVIFENDVIEFILSDISCYADDDTQIIFAIYEGDKSNIGKETNKGWQRNEKVKNYLPFIEKYFFVERCANSMIYCKKKE